MIYVDRERVPIPNFFSEVVKPYEEEILNRLRLKSKFKQIRFKQEDYLPETLFNDLNQLFQNKCAYCESHLNKTDIVDRFRPSESVSDQKGQAAEGYYWLSYTWFNLYLSCTECQRYKSNYFPVVGSRLGTPPVKTYQNYEHLQEFVSEEKALFLDPCDLKVHSEVQFLYDRSGMLEPQSKPANYTLDFLELNRARLVNERQERIKELSVLLTSVSLEADESEKLEKVLDSLEDFNSHLGLNRQYIAEWYSENEKLIEDKYPKLNYELTNALEKIVPHWRLHFQKIKVVSTIEQGDTSATVEEEPVGFGFSKFLEWVEISDFKCIEQTKLEIPQSSEGEGEQSILLIGENGVGKSTILQAISLAMMGNEQLQGLNLGNYSDLIRHNSKKKRATITIKFLNESKPVIVEITPTSISSNRKELVKPTVGIGSVRRMPEDGETVTFNDDTSRIMALFRHDVVFPDVQPWLSDTKAVSSHQFNEAAKTIIDMLMIPEDFISKDRMVNRKVGNVTVNVGNGPESIKSMCDGYRSVIGYALYIMRTLNIHWESAYHAEGLIIVDEIGNHLHPSWKIKVVSLLRQVFPRCTLIISTHDPLCLRAARKGEVWVMNLDQKDRRVQLQQKDIPMGISLENLLIGDWFFMDHTTDEKTSQLIEEHSNELFKENPDQMKVKELEAKLEQTVMKTSSGIRKLDTYFDLIRDVESEEKEGIVKADLVNDPDLRKKLAQRIRDQIK
jgi:predicted ATP-binding protein involved in virulence